MSDLLILLGSSRKGRKTGRVAKATKNKLDDRDLETEIFDLKEKPIPQLEERRHKTDDPHPNVEELGSKIDEAQILLIISPEYNHSYPGVLKNALDHFFPEYQNKLFAYITTSAGGFGGVRQQSHLHDFTLAVGGIPGPSLPISNIGDNFSEEGEVTSENYDSRIDDFLEKLTEKLD